MIETEIPEKKLAVMNATLLLVSDHGLEGVSTALISKEANVGMGTLYRYFESKEQLLKAVFERLREQMLKVVMEGIGRLDASIFQQFEGIIKSLIAYYAEHRLEFKFLQKYSDSSYMQDAYLDESAILLAPISHILSSGGEEFKFRDLPAEMLFAMIYGPLISILQLSHLNKINLTEERQDILIRSIWSSITENR